MRENTAPATVFVVDDDEAMRDSIRFLLESVDLPVRTFTCAQDFIESCDTGQKGCLLLDVRMPSMSGMELLEKLSAGACHHDHRPRRRAHGRACAEVWGFRLPPETL